MKKLSDEDKHKLNYLYPNCNGASAEDDDEEEEGKSDEAAENRKNFQELPGAGGDLTSGGKSTEDRLNRLNGAGKEGSGGKAEGGLSFA